MQNAFRAVDSDIEVVVDDIYYAKNSCTVIQDKTLIMTRANIGINNENNNILDVIIPYDTLLPVKSILMKGFFNKKNSQPNIWYDHFSTALLKTEIDLTVEIDCTYSTVSDIEKMQIGDTLITHKNAVEDLDLKVNGVIINRCKVGKIANKLAVEITELK